MATIPTNLAPQTIARCACGRPLPCGIHRDDDDQWPDDALASTSLDPLETSGREFPDDSPSPLPSYATPGEAIDSGHEGHAVCFRHSGWLPLRRRVQAALIRTSASIPRRYRFLACGSTYHVLQNKADPTKYKLCANACHDRFCLPCANERSRIVAHNVHKFLAGAQARFITLTLRSTAETLSELLTHLYDSFKALRKLPIWKKSQRGGVAFLEVKWNPKTSRWHPHFHVLCHGKYLDQAKLCTAWKAVTKTSWVCDIRAVKQEEHAVAYCTKYASKPFDREVLTNDDRLDESMQALEGKRMILTFGDWKGLRVTAKPDKDAWENVGTVAELARKAVTGDKPAMQLMIQLLGEHALQFLRAAQDAQGWTPPSAISWAEQHFVALDPCVPF
jgi:hypothetical protein